MSSAWGSDTPPNSLLPVCVSTESKASVEQTVLHGGLRKVCHVSVQGTVNKEQQRTPKWPKGAMPELRTVVPQVDPVKPTPSLKPEKQNKTLRPTQAHLSGNIQSLPLSTKVEGK